MSIRLTLAGAALAGAAFIAAPAQAQIYSVTFTGDVANQVNTGLTVGSAITGSFVYDAVRQTYLSFKVGTYGLPSGAFSSYVPAATTSSLEAVFEANQSNTGQGTPMNTSLVLDLEATNTFNTSNLGTFLTNPGALNANASDTDPYNSFDSLFSYTLRNSDGSVSTEVTANLLTLSASIPEPATIATLVIGFAGLASVRRRRA